jgi:UDP-N-acetylmuramate dehydrogenase
MSELITKLPKIRGTYRQDARVKNWFDVGGKAEIIFLPEDLDDLVNFLTNKPKEIPVKIIGAGSNVIISDNGVKGVLIRLTKEFSKISCNQNEIEVGAACLCANVALSVKDFELSGLEFLTGIPGAIGGAIAMNAGCYGSDISQLLISAKAIDFSGKIFEIKNSDFGFYYRGNKIAKDFIFISAKFHCKKSSSELIANKIFELNKKREESQPIRAKTGGSTFKNPSKGEKKAWQLIDESGCRGLIEGGAMISEKHCNFMINFKQSSACDLINLGNKVKKLVKEKTGVDLEWEIKIIE